MPSNTPAKTIDAILDHGAAAPPNRRGRPRDPGSDERILQAALRVLVERGYDSMSIDAVAAEAGVAKTTLYRRYAGKLELIVAAIEGALKVVEVADHGTVRADLDRLVRETQAVFAQGSGVQLASVMAFEQQHHPELISAVRNRMIQPRRAMTKLILQRGIARGEVRPEIDLEAVADLIAGAPFGWFFSGRAADPAWGPQVVDLLCRAVAPDKSGD